MVSVKAPSAEAALPVRPGRTPQPGTALQPSALQPSVCTVLQSLSFTGQLKDFLSGSPRTGHQCSILEQLLGPVLCSADACPEAGSEGISRSSTGIRRGWGRPGRFSGRRRMRMLRWQRPAAMQRLRLPSPCGCWRRTWWPLSCSLRTSSVSRRASTWPPCPTSGPRRRTTPEPASREAAWQATGFASPNASPSVGFIGCSDSDRGRGARRGGVQPGCPCLEWRTETGNPSPAAMERVTFANASELYEKVGCAAARVRQHCTGAACQLAATQQALVRVRPLLRATLGQGWAEAGMPGRGAGERADRGGLDRPGRPPGRSGTSKAMLLDLDPTLAVPQGGGGVQGSNAGVLAAIGRRASQRDAARLASSALESIWRTTMPCWHCSGSPLSPCASRRAPLVEPTRRLPLVGPTRPWTHRNLVARGWRFHSRQALRPRLRLLPSLRSSGGPAYAPTPASAPKSTCYPLLGASLLPGPCFPRATLITTRRGA